MLAEAGATVAVVSRRGAECEAVAEELANRYRTRCRGFRADIAKPDEIASMIEQVDKVYGRIDVMVSNAGTAIRVPAMDISPEIRDVVVDTNLRGAFFCAQEAARRMRNLGGGSIINVGSVHAKTAMKSYAHYGASKAGLSQLTRVLALEWGELGIRVNCVAPGSIPTDINREVLAVPENRQRNIDKTALKRLGTPRDIAGAVAFLASDLSDYVTGETIYVDGGWTIG
jgi:NAD(P)-dependent dehydrogenase (short-subunit alcohol dehydrogenase family)